MRGVIVALALTALATPTWSETLAERLEQLGGSECADSALTCLVVTVPLNHQGNDPTATLDVTFSIHLASEPSQGIIFYAVGGPGYGGNALAEEYLDAFEPDLTENFDFVFFDQRGMGLSSGLTCPTAQAIADLADAPIDSPDAAIAVARTYVKDCLSEIGTSSVLPYMATDQAIRDVEIFRQKIGARKVWVYGESYGTQFVQQYATVFPDAVAGVIMDGTVDLNLSLKGFAESYVAASEGILNRMLAACDAMPDCHGDMAKGAAKDFAQLRDQLQKGSIPVTLPLSDGTSASHDLTETLFLTNAFYALYGPYDRADFLRALALASRGDYVEMTQLGYANLGVDPLIGQADADPNWFGAAYYAVTCGDYSDEAKGDPEAAAMRILAEAKAVAASYPTFADDLAYDRLICAFWPDHGDDQRPEPFAGSADWPTLVLNADADPITPLSMARSVYDHAQNARLIVMQGGPHVIWGRGLACPDTAVLRLLQGDMPDGKVQFCEQDIVADYTPLTLLDEAAQRDPMTVARAVVTELQQSFDLQNWDGDQDLTVNCPQGGRLTASYAGFTETYNFEACSFWTGVAFSGTGSRDDDDEGDDGIWLNLNVKGPVEGGFSYVRNDTTEAERLSGTWGGRAIE